MNIKTCKCGTVFDTTDSVCPECRELIKNKLSPHFDKEVILK
tara:strand:- start:575 stop:700 length:126 start_codon:yes stop_codon:yes gene_type:complete